MLCFSWARSSSAYKMPLPSNSFITLTVISSSTATTKTNSPENNPNFKIFNMQALIVFSACLAVAAAGHIGYYGGVGLGYAGYHGVGFAAAAPVSSQYHAQDELGQYSYGYAGGPSAKSESRSADGVTRGAYSYVDANGLLQQVQYVSDPVNGFRVAATNLPVAPVAAGVAAVPVAPVHYAALPAPVQDTPEVAAAKIAHAQAHVEAAARAALA